jgi:alkylation response protein AidB-like acyl-CoA dehydrogenase
MTSTTSAKTESSAIIGAARALRPLIEARRDEIEQARRLPAELVQAMASAGLFHLLVPKAVGGLEIDPMTFVQVIQEVSKADGSAGWNVMIGASYGLIAGYLAENVAREIFARPSDVVAGHLAPTGKAVAVDGGYRISGRWAFASGIHQSTWLLATCLVYDGDQPRATADGAPYMRMMLLPTGDCEIHDTWHVGGLRGTGSDDYSISDLFVPEERSFLLFASQPHQDGALYRLPITFFSVPIAAVPLGIARAAIDTLVELAAGKASGPAGSSVMLRDHARSQTSVGRAQALVESANAYLVEALSEVWETTQRGDTASLEQRAKLRLACVNAAESAAQATELMYRAGGGSTIYERSPLERQFRDVNAALAHAGVSPSLIEDAGRVRLGLQPSSPRF